MRKRLLFFPAILVMTLACGGDDNDSSVISVTEITLNKTDLTLMTGERETITAIVRPLNATDRTLYWTSSDADTAAVTDSGLVIANKPGNAVITATTYDRGLNATCSVTTLPVDVTGVTINKTTLTLAAGAGETLIAAVEPVNATNKAITWASSNPSIATVSQYGIVLAYRTGQTTITVTTEDGGKTATCRLTVL